MVKPETGQANFSEKMMRPGGGVVGEDAALLALRRGTRPLRAGGATVCGVGGVDAARLSPVPSPTGRGCVGRVEIDQPFGQLQRRLQRIRQPRLDALADDQAVDHHLDVVLVFLVERRGVLDLVEVRRRCGRG